MAPSTNTKSVSNQIAVKNVEGQDFTLPTIKRDNTMLVTSKEGAAILQAALLDSTRSGTKKVQDAIDATTSTSGKCSSAPQAKKSLKPVQVKRDNTMTSTLKEAKSLFGRSTGHASQKKRLRSDSKKQSLPKIKRDTSMKKTAKEGNDFLRRTGHHLASRTDLLK